MHTQTHLHLVYLLEYSLQLFGVLVELSHLVRVAGDVLVQEVQLLLELVHSACPHTDMRGYTL